MQQSKSSETRISDVKRKYNILYIIDPAPCDKKCCSEHQTFFLLFGGGVWVRDYILRQFLAPFSGCSLLHFQLPGFQPISILKHIMYMYSLIPRLFRMREDEMSLGTRLQNVYIASPGHPSIAGEARILPKPNHAQLHNCLVFS